jgi:hypothetical protein
MTPPSASPERVPERSTTGPSQQRNAEDAAADGASFQPRNAQKAAQGRPQSDSAATRGTKLSRGTRGLLEWPRLRQASRGSRPRIYARSLIRRERLLGLVRLSCGRWRAPRASRPPFRSSPARRGPSERAVVHDDDVAPLEFPQIHRTLRQLRRWSVGHDRPPSGSWQVPARRLHDGGSGRIPCTGSC